MRLSVCKCVSWCGGGELRLQRGAEWTSCLECHADLLFDPVFSCMQGLCYNLTMTQSEKQGVYTTCCCNADCTVYAMHEARHAVCNNSEEGCRLQSKITSTTAFRPCTICTDAMFGSSFYNARTMLPLDQMVTKLQLCSTMIIVLSISPSQQGSCTRHTSSCPVGYGCC